MPKYTALDITPKFDANELRLSRCLWTRDQTFAEYIADGRANLRVAFGRAEVIRVLDDLTVLGNEFSDAQKALADHFGYIVEGSQFWYENAETIESGQKKFTHYRFLTTSSCVDIITSATMYYRTLSLAN